MLLQFQIKEDIFRNSKVDEEFYNDQKKRVGVLQSTCKVNGFGLVDSSRISSDQLKYVIVNDEHKIMFCYIPKVACTNWRRIFLILTGKMNTTDPLDLEPDKVHHSYGRHLSFLSDYSREEINYRLKHYFKFTFVREPFQRLLSAFRNKFGRYNEYFFKAYGKKMVKKYRSETDFTTPITSVKFKEFVKYLIDPVSQLKSALNSHWNYYYRLCHPCLLQYDAIGKYETLERDADNFLRIMGIQDTIKFPPQPKRKPGASTSDLMTKFYSQVPWADVNSLWETYMPDFVLFNYLRPSILKNMSKDQNEDSSER